MSATEAPSTTAVSSSSNPSVLGQLVTFTASVTGNAGQSPTGTVTFSQPLGHYKVTNRPKHTWQTWSHGYRGDVYYVPTSITLTLPGNTTVNGIGSTDGVPVLYWTQSATFTTHNCVDGGGGTVTTTFAAVPFGAT